ncbi:hypothetical protein KR093_005313, partial [Drosophila rubida]
MMQSVGQGSCVQHRLDQRSRVHHRHHWSGVHNGSSVDDGSVHNWSGVNGNGWGSVDDSGSSVDSGLQDGSDNMLDDWLAVHLGDALVGDSRGSAVHHSAYLGQDGLVHHMVGLDEASRDGGNQEGNNSDL